MKALMSSDFIKGICLVILFFALLFPSFLYFNRKVVLLFFIKTVRVVNKCCSKSLQNQLFETLLRVRLLLFSHILSYFLNLVRKVKVRNMDCSMVLEGRCGIFEFYSKETFQSRTMSLKFYEKHCTGSLAHAEQPRYLLLFSVTSNGLKTRSS